MQNFLHHDAVDMPVCRRLLMLLLSHAVPVIVVVAYLLSLWWRPQRHGPTLTRCCCRGHCYSVAFFVLLFAVKVAGIC